VTTEPDLDGLVERLLVHDVQLRADGDALHWDAPHDLPHEELSGLVAQLRRHKAGLLAWLREVDCTAVLARHALSAYQQRQWARHHEHPDPSVYNIRWEVELRGALRPAALADAVTALVARHEALRTRFVRRGAHPVAEVMAADAVPMPVVAPGDPRIAAVDRAFDTAEAPLLRALVVRRAAEDWTLLLVLHHLVCDHTTVAVLMDELSAFYAGRPPVDRPVQFADYARWERRELTDPAARAARLRHWRTELAGAQLRPPLPVDRPRPAVRSGRGAEHRFTVEAAVLRGLDELARRAGVTRHAVLCAAFARLLGRLTGSEDVVVIGSTSSRRRREHERTVGVFTDAVPLRVRPVRAATPAELVSRVGRAVFTALGNGPMPLGVLVRELDLGGTPPVPTVLFTVLGDGAPAPELPGVTATVVPGPPATVARMELYLTLLPYRDGLLGAAEYATELFDPATVERWCAELTGTLTELAADVDGPASDRGHVGRPAVH
jgi:hypothetical protein